MTASAAHYGVDRIPYPDILSSKCYDRLCNFYGSNLTTVMFVRHLARQLAQTHPHITVNCLQIVQHQFDQELVDPERVDGDWAAVSIDTTCCGARTFIYLILSEEAEGVNWEYWLDERIRSRNAASNDPGKQEEFIRHSNKAVGIPLGSSHL